MHRQPLLFFLRTATLPAFPPSKPYFSRQTFTNYSVGRMTSRGSGRNIRDLDRDCDCDRDRGQGRGRGRGRSRGRGRAPSRDHAMADGTRASQLAQVVEGVNKLNDTQENQQQHMSTLATIHDSLSQNQQCESGENSAGQSVNQQNQQCESGENSSGQSVNQQDSTFNVKDDAVPDSNCMSDSNSLDEASSDGSTNRYYPYRRSQDGQTLPKREANSSSKCTHSAIAVGSSYQQDEHILSAWVGKDRSPNTERTQQDFTSQNRAVGSSLRQQKNPSLVDSVDDKEGLAHSGSRPRTSQTPQHSRHQSYSPNLASANQRDRFYISRDKPSPAGKTRHEKIFSDEKAADHLRPEQSDELLPVVKPFDICQTKSGSTVALKPSLLVKNREKRKELECFKRGEKLILRQGMVLLKKYLSHSNQIKIIKKCRELGRRPGGFYQPGYRDGAKLHLHMMCLGKNWDPEKRSYGDCRLIDNACPPSIPVEFKQLVEEAIQDSHAFIKQDSKCSNVEEVLPGMSPDICIVNFYTESGRLGLHQDRDETEESLRSGLPVVSFSIGDSAEFLYGDNRDIEKVDKVVLESGDVLIFGGDSRHVYHGVSCIMRNKAPSFLVEEANLIPGRLNLTFRKY